MDETKLANLFKALSQKTRLQIFMLVCRHAPFFDADTKTPITTNTVSGLAKLLPIKQPTISHHISILEKANLVDSVRIGHFDYLIPNKETLKHIENVFKVKNLIETEKIRVELGKKSPIELNTFESLIELLTLNGFTLKHRTTIPKSFGSIRIYLQIGKDTESLVELTYIAVSGELLIRTTAKNQSIHTKKIEELVKLTESFIRVKNS